MPGPSGTFQVNGSHTYAASGVNGGTGIFTIQVFVTDVDGSKLTVPNTALVADRPITLTGILNPASDSGKSSSDDITDVSQPNFYGSSAPFSTVTLYETPIAGGTAVKIGQVEAQSDGSWSVTSNVLASGTYRITATAVDQFGETTTVAPVTIVPTLVVDTIAPVITQSELRPPRRDADGDLQGQPEWDGPGESHQLGVLSHLGQAVVEQGAPAESDLADEHHSTRPTAFRPIRCGEGGIQQRPFDAWRQLRRWSSIRVRAIRESRTLRAMPWTATTTGGSRPATACRAVISSPRSRPSITACLAGVPVKDGYVPPAAGIDPPRGLLDRQATARPPGDRSRLAKHGGTQGAGRGPRRGRCRPSR